MFEFRRGMWKDRKVTIGELLDDFGFRMTMERAKEATGMLEHDLACLAPPTPDDASGRAGESDYDRLYQLEIEVSERRYLLGQYLETADRMIRLANTNAQTIDVTSVYIKSEEPKEHIRIAADSARVLAHQANMQKEKLITQLSWMDRVLGQFRAWRERGERPISPSATNVTAASGSMGISGPTLPTSFFAPVSSDPGDLLGSVVQRLAMKREMRMAAIQPPMFSPANNFGLPPVTGWRGPQVAMEGRGLGFSAPRMW